jgi:hypothetical protein
MEATTAVCFSFAIIMAFGIVSLAIQLWQYANDYFEDTVDKEEEEDGYKGCEYLLHKHKNHHQAKIVVYEGIPIMVV